MRKLLLTTTFLSAAALGLPAAHAIDVTVGGEAGAEVTVGGNAGELNAEAGAGAGAAMEAAAGEGAEGTGMVDADGMVTIRAAGDDANATTMVTLDSFIGQSVHTNDGVMIGVVGEVMTDAEGNAVLLVDVDDSWNANIQRIAVYASSTLQADGQVWIDTTDEDLRASVEAGLAGGAAAGAGG